MVTVEPRNGHDSAGEWSRLQYWLNSDTGLLGLINLFLYLPGIFLQIYYLFPLPSRPQSSITTSHAKGHLQGIILGPTLVYSISIPVDQRILSVNLEEVARLHQISWTRSNLSPKAGTWQKIKIIMNKGVTHFNRMRYTSDYPSSLFLS